MGNTEQIKTEDYITERRLQEIASNKFAIRSVIYLFASMALCWVLTVTGFFIVSKVSMTQAVVLCGIILLIPVVASYYMDSGDKWLKYIILVSVCVSSSVMVAVLSFHAVFMYVLPLIMACQYNGKWVKWFTYALNTIMMGISMLWGFFYGLTDLNLLCVSMGDRSYYMSIVQDGTLTLPLNDNVVFIILVYGLLPRSIILAVFNLILANISSRTRGDSERLAFLRLKSDTDPMTGCYNHGKYDDLVRDYYFKVGNISAAYFDVNNLKVVNDSYGHQNGDKLIKAVSDACMKYFDEDRRKVFRMGGDEFLVLIEEPTTGEAESIVEGVYAELKKKNDTSQYPVSCSAGVAFGKGTDVISVVKLADTRMYAYKKAMKTQRED